jgi:hypothetical protein
MIVLMRSDMLQRDLSVCKGDEGNDGAVPSERRLLCLPQVPAQHRRVPEVDLSHHSVSPLATAHKLDVTDMDKLSERSIKYRCSSITVSKLVLLASMRAAKAMTTRENIVTQENIAHRIF